VREQRLGVEQRTPVTASVRGRARAIDDDVPVPPPVARVETVLGMIDPLDVQPAPFQLRDQPQLPLGMLVQDADSHDYPFLDRISVLDQKRSG